jgi:exodeoxyribonuclease VII small subunit
VVTNKTETAAPARAPVSFEEAMRELEAIVGRMDDGSLGLEESLAAYKRGAELVRRCQEALEAVREQVQVLDGEMLRPAGELLSERGPDAG